MPSQKKILDKVMIFFIAILLFGVGIGAGSFLNSRGKNTSSGEGQLVFEEASKEELERLSKANQDYECQTSEVAGASEEVQGQNSSASSQSSGQYVASSRGKKYYPAGCSAAKSLSPANLIYFGSQAEAEAAGYTQSTSCEY